MVRRRFEERTKLARGRYGCSSKYNRRQSYCRSFPAVATFIVVVAHQKKTSTAVATLCFVAFITAAIRLYGNSRSGPTTAARPIQVVSKQQQEHQLLPIHSSRLLELHPFIVHKKGLFAQLLLCDNDETEMQTGGKDVAVGNSRSSISNNNNNNNNDTWRTIIRTVFASTDDDNNPCQSSLLHDDGQQQPQEIFAQRNDHHNANNTYGTDTTTALWKACAEQDDYTRLDVQSDIVDRLVMFCPRRYYYPHRIDRRLRRRSRTQPPPLQTIDKINHTLSSPMSSFSSLMLVLTSPLRRYDNNLYHMLVMRNNQPDYIGRGRDLWCYLNAATLFIEQQKKRMIMMTMQKRRSGNNSNINSQSSKIRWRLEYHNQTGHSNYIKELFSLLGSDDEGDEDAENSKRKRNEWRDGDESSGTVTTRLSLRHPVLPRLMQLSERRLKFLQTGPIAHSFHFRPNTLPNEALMDVADHIVRLVMEKRQPEVTAAQPPAPPPRPFVLLVLRSGSTRRLAGAATGTAAEIVQALLDQSLPVRVMDPAEASVYDQITWFRAATVVIGMHGAGLTNLVWMDHGRRRRNADSNNIVTLIEIAASYGWGKYLSAAEDGGMMTCRKMDRLPLYMKADFYNLARRFRVRHELVHPVYSSVNLQPGNPIQKQIFYVDAQALAAMAKRALLPEVSSSSTSP